MIKWDYTLWKSQVQCQSGKRCLIMLVEFELKDADFIYLALSLFARRKAFECWKLRVEILFQ